MLHFFNENLVCVTIGMRFYVSGFGPFGQGEVMENPTQLIVEASHNSIIYKFFVIIF